MLCALIPRYQTTPRHRKTSAYLCWMWNGKLHCRVPFHKACLPSVHQYHTGLHARMINSTIPVNVHTYKHYSERICPLCHVGICDMQHVFVDCTALGHVRNHYAAILGGAGIMFPRLFQSGDPHVWSYVHDMIKSFADVCQRRKTKKRKRTDDD